MPAKPSRYAQSREALKQETRLALLKAASSLFARKGIDVSLDEICAEAGYTRGAFYVHFKNRDDLLAQVTERAGTGALAHLLGPEGEAAADLPTLATRFLQALMQGKMPLSSGQQGMRFHQFLTACARSPDIHKQYQANMKNARERLSQVLGQLQVQGGLRADLDVEALAAMIVTLVAGAQVFEDTAVDVPFEKGAQLLLQLLLPAAVKPGGSAARSRRRKSGE